MQKRQKKNICWFSIQKLITIKNFTPLNRKKKKDNITLGHIKKKITS